MFKNVLKIGLLAGLLALSCNAFAQGNEKLYGDQYPQYGWRSNWSVGGELSFDKQDNAGTGIGLLLAVEKEMNYIWDARFRVGGNQIYKFTDGNDRYPYLTLGFKYGIIDGIKGYDPNRKGNLYAAMDFGLAGSGIVKFWNENRPGILTVNGYRNFAVLLDLGLGYSYKFAEHHSIYVEGIAMTAGSAIWPWNVFKSPNPESESYHPVAKESTVSTHISLGYMYHFGPTAEDLELIAARTLLTQENFDNLNGQINTLNQEVGQSQQEVQKLKNNIEELNDRLSNAIANPSNGNADSLRAVIDQIKADQLTYYALPFSILFELDQYQIPADQMNKVKAIARVIKDTEGAKFKVVGFCDKSGSDDYNMKLSEKRAEALKKALVKQGVPEDRLEVEHYGKSIAFGDISFSVNRRASVYRVIE